MPLSDMIRPSAPNLSIKSLTLFTVTLALTSFTATICTNLDKLYYT